MPRTVSTALWMIPFFGLPFACGETVADAATSSDSVATSGATREERPSTSGSTRGGGSFSGDQAESRTSSATDGDGGSTGTGASSGEDASITEPVDELRIVFSGHSLLDVAVLTVRDVAQNPASRDTGVGTTGAESRSLRSPRVRDERQPPTHSGRTTTAPGTVCR